MSCSQSASRLQGNRASTDHFGRQVRQNVVLVLVEQEERLRRVVVLCKQTQSRKRTVSIATKLLTSPSQEFNWSRTQHGLVVIQDRLVVPRHNMDCKASPMKPQQGMIHNATISRRRARVRARAHIGCSVPGGRSRAPRRRSAPTESPHPTCTTAKREAKQQVKAENIW